MIAKPGWLASHGVDRIFIVGHIDQRAAPCVIRRYRNGASYAPDVGINTFIVRAKQALRTQHRKTCLQDGLRQQINHLFTGGFYCGANSLAGSMRTEIFFDITVMAVIKIE